MVERQRQHNALCEAEEGVRVSVRGVNSTKLNTCKESKSEGILIKCSCSSSKR